MWNREIIGILERIRHNSIKLNSIHTKRYMHFVVMLNYFDVPIIIASVFSSSFSSTGLVNPAYTTTITTLISMFIAILSSIKLYLNLTNNINTETELSKDYYLLSINIYKMIILQPSDTNPRLFLDEVFATYSKLIEKSAIIMKNNKKDLLTIQDDDNNSIKSQDSFNILSETNEF